MPTADRGVRLARADDADAVAAVQARAWREAYVAVLPGDVLDGLTVAALAPTWRAAVVTPPTPAHRLLVATDGADVVGYAATGPAVDPDLPPTAEAELLALVVDPEHRSQGHGSRLLAAVADTTRTAGAERLSAWLAFADTGLRRLLESAGWAPDGATRVIDLRGDEAVLVEQSRLRTDIRADSTDPSPASEERQPP